MNNENIYQAPTSNLDNDINKEYEYAGFWIRAGASIIDTILLLLVTMPLLFFIYGLSYFNSESLVHGTWDVLLSYIFPAVAVICFWLYRSATPGKMMLGLKVISLGNDEKLSVGQSIGRYIAYYPSMLVLMLGFIWVAFDKKKQGWHDKLAKTAVIRRP